MAGRRDRRLYIGLSICLNPALSRKPIDSAGVHGSMRRLTYSTRQNAERGGVDLNGDNKFANL